MKKIYILFIFFIILSTAVFGLEYILYDDASADSLSTKWNSGNYTAFAWNDGYYHSVNDTSNILNKNIDETDILQGVRYETHFYYGGSLYAGYVCIGDGNVVKTANAGNQNNYWNGYCADGEINIFYIVNGTDTFIDGCYNSPNAFINDMDYIVEFYIDNGHVIYKVNDTVILNCSDTHYIPDNQTSYMIYNRYYSDGYFVSDYVKNVYDIKYACNPYWEQQNTTCNQYNYTVIYQDTHNCNTTYLLPEDNGTIIDCEYQSINNCGTYTVLNQKANISISSFDANCLYLNLTNATVFCENVMTGSNSEVFAHITSMRGSIIKNCHIKNFLQGFLIDAYTLTDYGYNDRFLNITVDTISSGGIGFDAQPYTINNISFEDIVINNSYDNWGFLLVSMNDVDIYNLYVNGYSGGYFVLINNLSIDNSYFIGGTIYSLLYSTITDASISNTIIDDSANNVLVFISTHNLNLYNVKNAYSHLTININKYDAIDTTFNILSSYNRGWFPCDYTTYEITNINQLCYYNGTYKGYNNDGANLIFNKSLEYFINPKCVPDWYAIIQPCINNVKTQIYSDANDCSIYDNFPYIQNNTYADCALVTDININIQDKIWIPIIFVLLILIFIIIGIFIPPTLIISGILSFIFSVFGLQYFTDNTIKSILFWIFMGLGVCLTIIGLLVTIKWANE